MGSIFRRGSKREVFLTDDGPPAEVEAKELKAKLDELHELWRQPKDGCKRDMSLGVWLPEFEVVRVVQGRSKILQHMGFTWRTHLHLFPEEAVYLMDRGSMLLVDESGRLVPLAEAVMLMCCAGCDMRRYLVYCHFMRSGFYIKRHPAVWQLPQPAGSIAAMCATPAWRYRVVTEVEAVEGAVKDSEVGSSKSGEFMEGKEAIGLTAAGEGRKGETERGGSGEGKKRKWWPGMNDGHPWLALACTTDDIARLRRCRVDVEQLSAAALPSGGAPLTFPTITSGPASGHLSKTSQKVFDVFKSNSHLSRKKPDLPMTHICIAEQPPSLLDICAVAEQSTAAPLTLFAFVEDGVVSLFEGRLLDSQLPA